MKRDVWFGYAFAAVLFAIGLVVLVFGCRSVEAQAVPPAFRAVQEGKI